MPTLLRMFTALLAGTMIWLAFTPPTFLRVWLFGLLTIGTLYVGLTLAAYWDDV